MRTVVAIRRCHPLRVWESADCVRYSIRLLNRPAPCGEPVQAAKRLSVKWPTEVVAKQMRDKVTLSTVSAAVGEQRVAEIARMLGGEKLSSTTLAHAKEMLQSGV